MKVLFDVLYIFVYIGPFAVIRYYPFRDKLKISVWCLCLLYFALLSAEAAVFCLLSAIRFWNDAIAQTYRMGLMVFYAVMSFFLVRDYFFKQLFVWSLTYALGSLIMAVANFTEARFFPNVAQELPHAIIVVVACALIMIVFPFVFRFFKRIEEKRFPMDDANIWNVVWLAPLLADAAAFIATRSIAQNAVSSFSYLLVRILCFGSVLGFSILLYEVLRQTAENARLQEKNRMTDMQLVSQREIYYRLRKQIENEKAERHDFRHHLSVLKTYGVSRNIDGLLLYLDSFMQTIPENEDSAFCENDAVDAIVRFYAGLAREAGVDFSIEIKIPKLTGVNDADLCVILGNSLENALEANQRMKEGTHFIRMKAESRGNMLVILVDNSFFGTVNFNNGEFMSSKHSGYGVGTSSIKAVAKKYKGFTRFEYKDQVFSTSVMLQREPCAD